MNVIKTLWRLYQLKKNEKKSKSEMARLQNQKLRRMLRYAYHHSAYYKKSFEQAGINETDLETLPLSCFPSISKERLLAHFDELVTVPGLTQDEIRAFDEREAVNRKPYLGKYHVVHSSGSTGKPGYFVYDEAAWSDMLLGIIRAALWDMSMGEIVRLLLKRPRIVYIAATDGRYGGAMAVGDGIDGVGARQLYLDINAPLQEWIKKLREFAPNIIIGYPSAIKILGELLSRGQVKLDVIRVISCGEPLDGCLRNYFEKVFQADVINIYAASESLALGVETHISGGMLLFDDMNVIETENGKMYLTSLYNFAQPLIRYEITDHLQIEEAPEHGKYPFRIATGLVGRDEDVLWFDDGSGHEEFLHPLAIEGFCIEGLKDYQFRQLGRDAFEMDAEIVAPEYQEPIRKEMQRQMKRILREKRLDYVQFYVNFVEEIRADPKTGKKRLIISENEKGKIA
ncbi:MAG: phenylacetate--CoA ligase family protein [Clostridiales bacterium]|nr:phenylacetate--CoA ligase family protein [Clostridiales bacterium]